MSILLALFLAPIAQGTVVEYDCVAEKQSVVMSDGTEWLQNSSEVDEASRETFSYTFVATTALDGTINVSHNPALDIVGLKGEYTAVPLAPGQFAFSSYKPENCLFTELACTSLIEISDVNEDSAVFTLTTAGSVRNEDGTRSVLQMMFLGTCKKETRAT